MTYNVMQCPTIHISYAANEAIIFCPHIGASVEVPSHSMSLDDPLPRLL